MIYSISDLNNIQVEGKENVFFINSRINQK
jgi:hypothetical protein